MHKLLLFALAAFAAGAAGAQEAARADPSHPKAKLRVEYRSPFADYRLFADPEPVDWREVNEEVARVGGHAGYAKRAAGAKPTAKPPASAGHGAHR